MERREWRSLWVLSLPWDGLGEWQSLASETASWRVWERERRRSRESGLDEQFGNSAEESVSCVWRLVRVAPMSDHLPLKLWMEGIWWRREEMSSMQRLMGPDSCSGTFMVA